MRLIPGCFTRTLAAIALAMCFLAAPRAHAQATFREQLMPALTREDYKVIATRLALTKEQREAVDRLYEGYAAEHDRAAKALRLAWKEYGKTTKYVDGEFVEDPAAQAILGEAQKKYAEQKPGLQQAFLKDLRGVLEEAQALTQWDPIERMVRRQMMAHISWRSPVEWHRPDLVRGVMLLELPPEPLAKVQPLLSEYEMLVDKPLRRMESVRGKPGEDEQRIWMEGVIELRGLNKRFLRLITQDLPPEPAARLTKWARDLAYWDIVIHNNREVREGIEDAKSGRKPRPSLPTLSARRRTSAARPRRTTMRSTRR
jgi:hypothetical protein